MIDEADRDGDGEVNQQEFLRIMKKTCLYWRKCMKSGSVTSRGTALVFTCDAAHLRYFYLKMSPYFLCRAIPLNFRWGVNCHIVHWTETVWDPSIKAWSNARLIYMIIYNTFAKKQKEKTLLLVWNAAYFYEEYTYDINGFYVVMRFSVPTVTNTFQCFYW